MSAVARKVAKPAPAWLKSLSKWIYSTSYFPQIGLHKEDTYELTPEVEEALRRLPARVKDQRNFRIIRAQDLSNQKAILPKDEWTKYEDDIEKPYLQPYLEQVEKEIKEKKAWNRQ